VKKCQHCREEVLPGDAIMAFNNGDVIMHRVCGLRGVIGSVAHLQRRCSCYVKGSTEDDPPEMTRRQAAEAAVTLWETQNLGSKDGPKIHS